LYLTAETEAARQVLRKQTGLSDGSQTAGPLTALWRLPGGSLTAAPSRQVLRKQARLLADANQRVEAATRAGGGGGGAGGGGGGGGGAGGGGGGGMTAVQAEQEAEWEAERLATAARERALQVRAVRRAVREPLEGARERALPVCEPRAARRSPLCYSTAL